LTGLEEEGFDCFDLISMAHVLEHIPNPVGYLSGVQQKFLGENGYLLLEVPNLYSHDSFEVAHLSSFSPHTLVETLKAAGFLVLSMKKHGAPRSKLLPLYITVLAQKNNAAIQPDIKPEAWVRQKRTVGMFKRRILQRLLPGMAWQPLGFNEKRQ
jgi:hypothetical protein